MKVLINLFKRIGKKKKKENSIILSVWLNPDSLPEREFENSLDA